MDSRFDGNVWVANPNTGPDTNRDTSRDTNRDTNRVSTDLHPGIHTFFIILACKIHTQQH
jgi:hypothetical protein